MPLHIIVKGPEHSTAPPLVFLHGWGFHSGIWGACVDELARRHLVYLVDLPGHGHSPLPREYSLGALARALSTELPEGAVWVGWSLGGLAALATALHAPQHIRGLLMLTATPRFTRAADWPNAAAEETLQQFGDNLRSNPAATLRRFLTLQIKDSEAGRRHLHTLRALLETRPAAHKKALTAGLELLQNNDLRAASTRLHCPVTALLGERDVLVPAAMAEDWRRCLPTLRTEVIAGAGHVPFLSHPEAFLLGLERFLEHC